MAIDPTFLASLRRQHNCQDVLLLVQLEQVAPGWWPDQDEMAAQLGTERSTLCHSLRRMEARGWIRRWASKGGTHVWWVRRSEHDEPDDSQAPAWKLRDHNSHMERVILGREREWCERREIPLRTFLSLTAGRIKLLRRRWRLVGSPWDLPDCEDV